MFYHASKVVPLKNFFNPHYWFYVLEKRIYNVLNDFDILGFTKLAILTLLHHKIKKIVAPFLCYFLIFTFCSHFTFHFNCYNNY